MKNTLFVLLMLFSSLTYGADRFFMKDETIENYGKKIEIGEGLYYKDADMGFSGQDTLISITGKMTNLSGVDYSFVFYTVNLYDDDDNLIAAAKGFIDDIRNGETKEFYTFTVIREGIKVKGLVYPHYKIVIDNVHKQGRS